MTKIKVEREIRCTSLKTIWIISKNIVWLFLKIQDNFFLKKQSNSDILNRSELTRQTCDQNHELY